MEYKEIRYNEYSDKMLNQLEKGAFLTTKNGDKVNTMTIAWGSIGYIWNKPVYIVYVRYSRETYKLLEKSHEFTVSIPLNKDLGEELAYCGSKSGRDYDKIKESNLGLLNSRTLNTPILSDCDLHYECKIIYKQAMEPGNILVPIKDRYYKQDNYHVVFYGEIVDSYIIKGEK